jgi:UDP-glucose 4-epimerase
VTRGVPVFIAGSSGYLGTFLSSYLKSKGFSVLGDFEFFSARGLSSPLSRRNAMEDVEFWQRVLSDFDYVVHLAGTTELAQAEFEEVSQNSPDLKIASSIKTAYSRAPVRAQLIYTSTATVYGPHPTLPVSENDATCPVTAYDRMKLSVEEVIADCSNHSGSRPVIFRLPNIYGIENSSLPRGSRGLLNKMINRAFRGLDIDIYGGRRSSRDFLYLADLGEAFAQVLNSQPSVSGLFNLGSGNELSFEEAGKKVLQVAKKFTGHSGSLILAHSKNSRQEIDSRRYLANYSRFRQLTGWAAQVSFEQGVEKSMEYLRVSSR